MKPAANSGRHAKQGTAGFAGPAVEGTSGGNLECSAQGVRKVGQRWVGSTRYKWQAVVLRHAYRTRCRGGRQARTSSTHLHGRPRCRHPAGLRWRARCRHPCTLQKAPGIGVLRGPMHMASCTGRVEPNHTCSTRGQEKNMQRQGSGSAAEHTREPCPSLPPHTPGPRLLAVLMPARTRSCTSHKLRYSATACSWASYSSSVSGKLCGSAADGGEVGWGGSGGPGGAGRAHAHHASLLHMPERAARPRRLYQSGLHLLLKVPPHDLRGPGTVVGDEGEPGRPLKGGLLLQPSMPPTGCGQSCRHNWPRSSRAGRCDCRASAGARHS